MQLSLKLILTLGIVLNTTFSYAEPLEPKYEFTPRDEAHCSDLNSEMSDWYQKKEMGENSIAPLDLKIGKIRDQGNINWCFAYAASDMLANEIGQSISAAQVAKNYYEKSRIAWIWGGRELGMINDAIDLNFNRPLCTENDFSSFGVNLEQAQKKICEHPINTFTNYKTKKTVSIGLNLGGSTFFALDKILEEGKIAGIHYNADKFYDNEKSNIRNAWANHASTIVARYFDQKTNTCRYLIRNSYGSRCPQQLKNNSLTCADGYYSASESLLNYSLNEVIELVKK